VLDLLWQCCHNDRVQLPSWRAYVQRYDFTRNSRPLKYSRMHFRHPLLKKRYASSQVSSRFWRSFSSVQETTSFTAYGPTKFHKNFTFFRITYARQIHPAGALGSPLLAIAQPVGKRNLFVDPNVLLPCRQPQNVPCDRHTAACFESRSCVSRHRFSALHERPDYRLALFGVFYVTHTSRESSIPAGGRRSTTIYVTR
jgi:hypothetical protein